MSDTSGGPGWWQASDGKWYPPQPYPGQLPPPPQGWAASPPPAPDREAGDIRFPMALRVADIFKIVAVLVLIASVLAALAGGIDLGRQTDASGAHVNSGGTVVGFIVATLVGGAVAASLLGFFAYVLEILIATYSEIWEMRVATVEEDE